MAKAEKAPLLGGGKVRAAGAPAAGAPLPTPLPPPASEYQGSALTELGVAHGERAGVPVDLSDRAVEGDFVARTDLKQGLSESVARARLAAWGPNELEEKKRHWVLVLLSFLWGPMPIMIWLAMAVEVTKASITGDGWPDFGVLLALQIANASVGFHEEMIAGDAIAALKNALKPASHVCRDGRWYTNEARDLVPGDLIEVKLGDVVPADAVLLPGMPLTVDQSALTGESLPTTIHPGDKLKMGSAIKRGESKAVVVATGANTFFGKAAALIGSVQHTSRFQVILFRLTLTLLVLCLIIAGIIFVKLQINQPDTVVKNISTVVVILVASIPIAIEVICTSTLAVGSRRLAQKRIIVARLSAIEELAGMNILCSDKTGTLTLNELELRAPILFTAGVSADEVLFLAVLASKREQGNQDAIDLCVTRALPERERARLHAHEELAFEPFNPTDKRTEATVRAPGAGGGVFKVTKGAPQYILRMAHNKAALKEGVDSAVQELADRGFRALGLAVSRAAPGEPDRWEFVAVMSLFDPPRPDTKATIAAAIENGIEVKVRLNAYAREGARACMRAHERHCACARARVRAPRERPRAHALTHVSASPPSQMVTGDQTAIAKETCRELGMGTNILNTDVLNHAHMQQSQVDEVILSSHGFAEVMPEHKFQIVERLRAQGYVVGMTGDGVNDAPALKRADIGIAVFPATDAAKAAADIVLTEPGLSVIIDAIFRSRKIFQRMRNYCIYRISCTLQLLFFFFMAIMAIDPEDPTFYGAGYVTNETGAKGRPFGTCGPDAGPRLPADDCANDYSFTLPVISLVIITILNDGCMITIAHDKVVPEKEPQKWAMLEVTLVSVTLAAVDLISSMLMLTLLLYTNVNRPGGFVGATFGSEGRNYVRWMEARTLLYMKISVSDFLTIFAARTRTWFWTRRPGNALLTASLVAMGGSTLLALFWGDIVQTGDAYMASLSKSKYAAVAVWVYCLIWLVVQDLAKNLCYSTIAAVRRSFAGEEHLGEAVAHGKIARMMDEDARKARSAGVKLAGRARGKSMMDLFAAGGGGARDDEDAEDDGAGSSSALRAKVEALEGELKAIRALLTQSGIGTKR